MTNKIFFLVFFIFNVGNAFAESYFWIIGGGPKKENSQIQIERNVKWAREVIKNNAEKPILKIFYSDGDDPAPDVINYLDRNDLNNDDYLFDLVFGGSDVYPIEYTNHTILNHSGSTRPEHLIPSLKKDFAQLKNTDTALVLFNGHGWKNSDDYGLNTLRLWGEEKKLTVYEFEDIFSYFDDDIPVRFILTQCYSGGFSRLIHPGAKENTMDLKGNRCGFMAESASREAEGCSSSLKVGQYRDYTTFMFAALDGKTRLGKPLEFDPDTNRDMKTSLREAHHYALSNAYSTDLSRSTSEYYLEKWEPWYLRWLPKDKRSEESIFHKIGLNVLEIQHIALDISLNPSKLRSERVKRQSKFEMYKIELETIKNKIKSEQKLFIAVLEERYPGVKNEYKNKLAGYSNEKKNDIKTKIIESDQLVLLKQYFEEKDRLDLVLLDAERSLTQIEKVERLHKLSKIDSLFAVFADTAVANNYEQLISCEETYL